MSKGLQKPKRLFRNRPPTDPLASKVTRSAIADAVHHAVCEYTNSDGLGCCHRYAVAGQGLLKHLGKPVWLQGGTLRILLNDFDNLALTMLGENWRDGELHVWLADQREVIDFSARLYRRMAEDLITVGGELPSWQRPEPPDFVWEPVGKLPHWLKLEPVQEACEAVWTHHLDHDELIELAIEIYEEQK